MKSRKFRKSRKMRKTRVRKTKRGGSPLPNVDPIPSEPLNPIPSEPVNPIPELPITFAAYNDTPIVFNPNFATPDNIREIFSSALINNMNPNVDLHSPQEKLGLPVKINRIRGEKNEEVDIGDIDDEWDNDTITNFLSELQPGDHIRLTIA